MSVPEYGESKGVYQTSKEQREKRKTFLAKHGYVCISFRVLPEHREELVYLYKRLRAEELQKKLEEEEQRQNPDGILARVREIIRSVMGSKGA